MANPAQSSHIFETEFQHSVSSPNNVGLHREMKRRSSDERVAFSPGEFAALFGKSVTWGYRQLYAGRVKAITEFGRIQIPAAEVERVLESAGIYDGLLVVRAKAKPSSSASVARMCDAWRQFLTKRRAPTEGQAAKGEPAEGRLRREALARLRAPRSQTGKGSA